VIKINGKRRTYTTTIDLDLQKQFKAKCTEKNIRMNDLLETFMKMFIQENFEFDNSKTIVSKK
jgi:hypothetical protein